MPSNLWRQRFLAGVLLLLGQLSQSHAASSPIVNSVAPDRAAQLEAAARAEGALTLYTSLAKNDVQPLVEPFEKKYGIKVEVWRAGSEEVLQRVLQEQRAGRFSVDAVHTFGSELEALRREQLLQPFNSPHFADLVPGTLSPDREWAGTFLAVFVQAYNTNLVEAADRPKAYADLLDPKWKGKLGYEADDVDWFISVAKSMGEEKGLDFFRKLKAGNGLSIRKGHSLLNTLTAAGEVPMGLTAYNYLAAQAKRSGAPVDWFVIEPAVASPSGVAIMKNAQHPNAAALFADFMLGEGQGIFNSLGYVGTSKNAQGNFADVSMKVVAPADMIDDAAKWTPLFKQIVLEGGGN